MERYRTGTREVFFFRAPPISAISHRRSAALLPVIQLDYFQQAARSRGLKGTESFSPMPYVRLILSVLTALVVPVLATAQVPRPVQYASSVIDFSTEYANVDYSASRALGAPDVYPLCGDHPYAWASASASGQREFLVLGFATPQPVNTIRIFQNIAPGAIDTVYLRNAATGIWQAVYTAVAAPPGDSSACPGLQYQLLEIVIPTTPYDVNAIRIAVNSPAVPSYWNEIDAVGIADFDLMQDNWTQYASNLIDFSSEYLPGPGSYSAASATGAPDCLYCGYCAAAWEPQTADGQREFITLGYAFPAPINRVSIHQGNAAGAVDTVYVRDPATGAWHAVYSVPAAALPCPSGSLLEINFTKTPYSVDAVRIAVNSPAVPGWNEIDAVGIRAELPAGAIISAGDGPWNAAATWEGGIVPTAADTVLIGATHDVTVSTATATAGDLFITAGGKVIADATGVLTVGPAGGGRGRLTVSGNLTNTGGAVRVNGSVRFNQSSTLAMTAGSFTLDGNDGTAAGSVPDSLYILDFAPGMASFSFTGDTLRIVDPAFGPSGRTLRIPYDLGASSVLALGDGISTTAGGSANGFILTDLHNSIGHLRVGTASTAASRRVTIGDPLTVQKSCRVISGTLNNASNLTVLGP